MTMAAMPSIITKTAAGIVAMFVAAFQEAAPKISTGTSLVLLSLFAGCGISARRKAICSIWRDEEEGERWVVGKGGNSVCRGIGRTRLHEQSIRANIRHQSDDQY